MLSSGELANAVRKKQGIKFGTYHSLFEWYNPMYLSDKANGFKTQDFVREKTLPELYELVNNYKSDVIWSDGDWETTDVYWNATEFLAWLYNESPVKDSVVVNDRWGKNIRCKHGGFLNCDDRFNPGVLQKRKWENSMTIDKYSWGYRRRARLDDFLTMDDITKEIASTVSCGGNLLINIGPTHDGRIVPMFEERLRQMGEWLGVNGEAIYASKPWSHQNDTLSSGVWYTSQKSPNGTSVYAIVLDWPDNNVLKLGAPVVSPVSKVSLLGYSGQLTLTPGVGSGVTVTIPPISINEMKVRWAWVFKFTGLQN
ncbi:Alpha-L-fucosidase [Mizuhopecten yessoensis]|uniref:alpha-L-fucosidase n=1 Tax=Mizuhopecten yessoensis TaxID=6573 RepID=A0A210QVK2_MIZYE|nr:Alpha-L-fucosidase [Mizuhopecten yessoensis]